VEQVYAKAALYQTVAKTWTRFWGSGLTGSGVDWIPLKPYDISSNYVITLFCIINHFWHLHPWWQCMRVHKK